MPDVIPAKAGMTIRPEMASTQTLSSEHWERAGVRVNLAQNHFSCRLGVNPNVIMHADNEGGVRTLTYISDIKRAFSKSPRVFTDTVCQHSLNFCPPGVLPRHFAYPPHILHTSSRGELTPRSSLGMCLHVRSKARHGERANHIVQASTR